MKKWQMETDCPQEDKGPSFSSRGPVEITLQSCCSWVLGRRALDVPTKRITVRRIER